LAISQSGFTLNAAKAAEGHKNVLLMSGGDFEEVLDAKIQLPELIRKIRRRMAEEGKPYTKDPIKKKVAKTRKNKTS
jgi:L-lactate utilization protein LutB